DNRKRLLHMARAYELRQLPTFAGDILSDLVRLELWAWKVHRHVPPSSEEPAVDGEEVTFSRLLDLWECRGARERLLQLQQWGEEAGYGDISRILLNRYLPQPARGS